MTDLNTSNVYDASLAYIERGWAIMPVHGLADPERKVCTCGQFPCGPDNDRAGKHPVQAKWTSLPKMSRADAYATWEEDGPDWNIGVRSGEISGVWFLDIDPKNGGDLSLIELLNEHGRLPETYTVRTGSGGTHYGFKVPVGVKIKSSQRSKRLPAGIDVRGDGGMVIAAPSVSGIGPYELVDGREPVDAPQWLLDLVVAPEHAELEDSPVVEDLPAYADLDPDDQRRAQAYAEAAVRNEAARYEEAPPGTGNAALFTAACNIIEIVQSPWNTLTTVDAVRVLDAARERRLTVHPGRGQDYEEFRKTFGSAQSTVIGKGRPLPADRRDDLLLDVPPFSGAPAMTGDDDGLTFDVPAAGLMPAIKERGSALDRLRGRLHTRSQLDGIMPPTPLIEGIIDCGTMTVLAGMFGSFKSFTTIGWACSIATGKPWLGHQVVTDGPVLYIAAEGASGLKKRVAAWEQQNGIRVPDDRLLVLDVPVNVADDEQCSALLTLVKEIGAVLVIFDTLHRCASSLDEKDNTDMGRITAVADALREHGNGCTSLYVHHTGHAGQRSRGASSIEDDADAVWVTKLTGADESRDPNRPRYFEQRKTKDSPLLDPFYVLLSLEEGTDSGALVLADENGRPVTGTAGGDPFMQVSATTLDDIQARINMETNENAGLLLSVFMDVFAEHASGVTKPNVKAVAREKYATRAGWSGGSFKTTFERAWGRLQARGVIEENGGARWIVVPPEDRPQTSP